jgi:hypothetical protein
MRDDLLEAQASVDWAVSKLPAFERALRTWLDDNTEVGLEEMPAPATHDFIVVIEKASFPREFVVEAGAYVNTIRSGLDILACAIGKRESVLSPDNHYFPVARSAQDFATGNYKGYELVRGLPRHYRDILEAHRPYNGGNKDIWACHHLDITRKHKRLVTVATYPSHYQASMGISTAFDFVSQERIGNNKTTIAKLIKGAKDPEVYASTEVTFDEPDDLSDRRVIPALRNFAKAAAAVIKDFDIV